MLEFREKTAVITGTASGIGAALARAAAARGMNLALADLDATGAQAVAASCGDVPNLVMAVDVSLPKDVENLAAATYDRFGEVSLLCNNAGVVPGGRHRPVWEYEPADWQWAFDVNLMGIVHGLRSFVPRMLQGGQPAHIVNTTSVSGFISGAGSPVYGASKHAAVRATEALYASLRERGAFIGVTMLCPGLVNTAIFASERNRPTHLQTGAETVALPDELNAISAMGSDPDEVAELAFQAVTEDRLYAFTTDRFDEMIRRRGDSILQRSNPIFEDFVAMSKRDAQPGSSS